MAPNRPALGVVLGHGAQALTSRLQGSYRPIMARSIRLTDVSRFTSGRRRSHAVRDSTWRSPSIAISRSDRDRRCALCCPDGCVPSARVCRLRLMLVDAVVSRLSSGKGNAVRGAPVARRGHGGWTV
jgi:hypothetical protein